MISQDRNQFNPSTVQPAHERLEVGGRSTTRGGRLDEVAGHDQAKHLVPLEELREFFLSLGQRMSGQTIASGASGPLVAKVNVGDHGDPGQLVDCGSFRGEPPTIRSGDHCGTSR